MKKYNIYMFFLLCLFIVSCAPLHNYTTKYSPRYSYVQRKQYETKQLNSLKVVSYNIKHSQKIDKALYLLTTDPNLKNADIILLQEMTPKGMKKIAQALNYNYVYYPALLHPFLKQNFGNAILSKWPISEDHKIILPPITQKTRGRIAVGATITINHERIKVFSLHMGIFIKPDERKNLVNFIIETIDDSFKYCIIGGDFNSFTKKDRVQIKDSFQKFQFTEATKNIDWTYNQWYFLNRKAQLDYIYIKNLEAVKAGKIIDRSGSDHLPIWTELSF